MPCAAAQSMGADWAGYMQVRRREALEAIAYGKSEVAGKDAGAMTDEDRYASLASSRL